MPSRSALRFRVDPAFALGFSAMLLSVTAFVLFSRSPRPPSAPSDPPIALFAEFDSLGLNRFRGAYDAPDTLTEITDFLCAACARADERNGGIVDSLVISGRLHHRVFKLPVQAGALQVSAFASCVWESDHEDYWRLRPVLFEAQRAILAAYPIDAELLRLAEMTDVDSAGIGACYRRDRAKLTSRFSRSIETAYAAGIPFTPVFWLNQRLLTAPELSDALLQMTERP